MIPHGPKVLFVGDGWLGSNARSFAEGFRQAGAEVVLVDTTSVSRPARFGPTWTAGKVLGRRAPWSIEEIHRQVEEAVQDWKPDVLFCFKTIHLDQKRLLELKVPTTVHYSADDVSNPYNVTRDYLECESQWNLIVTTKQHNVGELTARGVNQVLMVMSAFDPAWHHPAARRGLIQNDVGFIGNYRPDRHRLMSELGRKYEDRFSLEGPGWSRKVDVRRSGAKIGPGVYGEDFSFSVASTLANLVLLNTDNRDTHTCRSFEVPAAGGLFVGERTVEHQELLEDGKECFLFSTGAELFEVLERVLADRSKSTSTAIAGHRRIMQSSNRYADRAKEVLHEIARIRR